MDVLNHRPETTLTGDVSFLAYIQSWWYFRSSLVGMHALLFYFFTPWTRVTPPHPPPPRQTSERNLPDTLQRCTSPLLSVLNTIGSVVRGTYTTTERMMLWNANFFAPGRPYHGSYRHGSFQAVGLYVAAPWKRTWRKQREPRFQFPK
jgi:hypothetical protein